MFYIVEVPLFHEIHCFSSWPCTTHSRQEIFLAMQMSPLCVCVCVTNPFITDQARIRFSNKECPNLSGWENKGLTLTHAMCPQILCRISDWGSVWTDDFMITWKRLHVKSYPGSFFFFFFLKRNDLFIYLFLAVLGPRLCARAFPSCGKRGPLFIAVRGPLTVTASLVAEHRLQTRRLSSCGSRA